MIENYQSILKQLNKKILELANKNSHVLIDDNANDIKTIKTIIEGNTFKNAIHRAKEKLEVDTDDDFEFYFADRQTALDTLIYVVAIYRGMAVPYADYDKTINLKEDNTLSDEEKEFLAEKDEEYVSVYYQIGKERMKKLEGEIVSEINSILTKCGMPQTQFQYIATCLLGDNYLNFHVNVLSEHAERLKVVDVQREFIDLRIYKGIEKKEYHDCWKAIEDYLTHNVPVGLVRVKNISSKLYNDKINNVKVSDIQAEYYQKHPASDEDGTRRNMLKMIKMQEKYKHIVP